MEPKEKSGPRKYPIKDYTLKDLALIYGISRYHMKKRLSKVEKLIGKREGYFYEPEQVRLVFENVPLPSGVEII